MERLLGGTLAALVLLVCLAPSANAAEIPPTAKCEAFFKKQFRESLDLPETQINKAVRKSYKDLEAADCLTDAQPLLKSVPAEPFTGQCREAATAADGFWDSRSRRFKALFTEFTRDIARPHKRKLGNLTSRIKRLKSNGRQDKAAELVRERKQLIREFRAENRIWGKKMWRLVARDAFKTTLIVYEFISLRCMSVDGYVESGKGPVQRVLNRNIGLVFMSMMSIYIKEQDHKGSARSFSPPLLPDIRLDPPSDIRRLAGI